MIYGKRVVQARNYQGKESKEASWARTNDTRLQDGLLKLCLYYTTKGNMKMNKIRGHPHPSDISFKFTLKTNKKMGLKIDIIGSASTCLIVFILLEPHRNIEWRPRINRGRCLQGNKENQEIKKVDNQVLSVNEETNKERRRRVTEVMNVTGNPYETLDGSISRLRLQTLYGFQGRRSGVQNNHLRLRGLLIVHECEDVAIVFGRRGIDERGTKNGSPP